MDNIFVSTDFLEVSDNAMNFSAELARQFKADLHMVHAYHLTPIYSDFYVDLREEQLKQLKLEGEERLNKWAKEQAPDGEFNSHLLVKNGLAVDVIVEEVNKAKPDLLVMGTRKAGLLDKVVFGSITGAVLPKVKCPLLAVPQNSKYVPFTQIVFATDLHESDLLSISQLVDLAKPVNGTITVLHAINSHEIDSYIELDYYHDFQKEVRESIDYPNLVFQWIHSRNLVNSINDFVEKSGANLLAMSQTDKNWFVRLFDASITRQQFLRLKIPTLFFKAIETFADEDF